MVKMGKGSRRPHKEPRCPRTQLEFKVDNAAPAATHITITNNVAGSNNIVYLASIMNIIGMQGNELQALKLPSPSTSTTFTIINNVSGSDSIVYSASAMDITDMQESDLQDLKAQVTLKK